MDFVIRLRQRDAERAAALQSRLRLRDISLYKCSVDGAGPPLETIGPFTLKAELDSELVLQDASGVDYAVTLRVDRDEPVAFHIHATFLARYAFEERSMKASNSELEAFRKSHAVLAVWPYLREFVQTVAARMGFPAEPLPLLRLILQEPSGRRART